MAYTEKLFLYFTVRVKESFEYVFSQVVCVRSLLLRSEVDFSWTDFVSRAICLHGVDILAIFESSGTSSSSDVILRALDLQDLEHINR